MRSQVGKKHCYCTIKVQHGDMLEKTVSAKDSDATATCSPMAGKLVKKVCQILHNQATKRIYTSQSRTEYSQCDGCWHCC